MHIIHGDNQVASRNYYLKLKSDLVLSQAEVLEFFGDQLTLNDLVAALQTISLTNQSPHVFVSGLFSRRPSNERKLLVDYLLAHPTSEVYVWEAKDVALQLKSFPPSTIKAFPLPKLVFAFLDTFDVKLLPQLWSTTEPEQLLGLLAKRVHDLLLFHAHQLQLPSWQLAKLTSLARRFPPAKLISLNTDLLHLDYLVKTSRLSTSLSVGLELLFVKLNNDPSYGHA